MVVDLKQAARWVAIALIALAIWLIWWSRPERQVRRAQTRLLGAMESRDYMALAGFLADDYRDAWNHDKANVLRRCPQVLDQFLLLDIEGDIRSVAEVGGTWQVQQKIVVKGLGGHLGMYAQAEVNRLKEPFTMQWRKRSWKPWDWEVFHIDQPELQIPEG